MSKRKQPRFYQDHAGHWHYVAQERADGSAFRTVDINAFVTERIKVAVEPIVSSTENLRTNFVVRGERIIALEQQLKALHGDLDALRVTCGELQALNLELKQREAAAESLLARLNNAIREAFDLGIEDGALIVHRAWLQERKAQGFHQTKRWHFLFLCNKCHDCMVPYDELDNGRKNIDRRVYSAVRGALKLALENLRLGGGS